MTFKPSLIFSFLAALPLSAVHADDSKTLPQIVVTATRSPVPLSQVASSMTVITRKDIEQQNRSDVTDLLRQVPGVIVASNGAAGQTARVFMRGTKSNHVLVMMDGVALNDPSGVLASDPNRSAPALILAASSADRPAVIAASSGRTKSRM